MPFRHLKAQKTEAMHRINSLTAFVGVWSNRGNMFPGYFFPYFLWRRPLQVKSLCVAGCNKSYFYILITNRCIRNSSVDKLTTPKKNNIVKNIIFCQGYWGGGSGCPNCPIFTEHEAIESCNTIIAIINSNFFITLKLLFIVKTANINIAPSWQTLYHYRTNLSTL